MDIRTTERAPGYTVGGADTTQVDRADRLDYWREHVVANHGSLRFDFAGASDFKGGTRVQRAGQVQLVDFWSDAMAYHRRAKDYERDGDDAVRVVLPTAGQIMLNVAGERSRLVAGIAATVSMTTAFAFEHDEHTRAFILSVPGSVWDAKTPTTPMLWKTDSGSGAVVASIVGELAKQATALDTGSFRSAVEAALDLLAHSGDAETPFALRSQAIARRRCADASFDPAALAEALGMPLRTLQLRLSQEGTSPADIIRDVRLELVARRLKQAHWHGRTVSSVAYASGFGSLTAFNQAFRQRYDVTPSEFRRD